MIPVTKPYLPPQNEYISLVNEIWKRNWITNNGPLVNKLELDIKEYLGLKHFLYVTNGTIAIQMAYKLLGLSGKIITTPFSYVATTSSAVWEGLEPVFCDIDPKTFNVNPDSIEEKITKEISGILVTHVFGNPCDIEKIERIAKKHNLKIIYDASHCFGVMYKGKSVYQYGDISTASFHATKLFHTIEGGGIITQSSELTRELAEARNFGHDGFDKFGRVGINGKNSEFHAAMGLTVLNHFEAILSTRKEQFNYYVEKLRGLEVTFQKLNENVEYNYGYFPVVFSSEKQLLKSKEMLEDNGVYCRRYFYPSLNKLSYVKEQECNMAESLASRILCLPLYHELAKEEQDYIARLLLRAQNN